MVRTGKKPRCKARSKVERKKLRGRETREWGTEGDREQGIKKTAARKEPRDQSTKNRWRGKTSKEGYGEKGSGKEPRDKVWKNRG